ncbi:hypothetical protein [Aequorivita ciconiae]|uniref:hypothetical protein n=1 Tax=Aequorivita ciconiae TaxID=2494375 RepID=UPI0013E395D4|nr:hypothetical protein [Aequorivita sp. H23M31]
MKTRHVIITGILFFYPLQLSPRKEMMSLVEKIKPNTFLAQRTKTFYSCGTMIK